MNRGQPRTECPTDSQPPERGENHRSHANHPVPTQSGSGRTPARELPLETKAALVSGRDFWSTRPIEEAGIPSILVTDGPHGVRRQAGATDHLGMNASVPATCFPPAVAIGSSWNPALAERVGAAIGREAKGLGVQLILGPGINIKRSPLCGRNFEYYSEDPLLSGSLGAAHVQGLQAQGIGASVKHFAANNQETNRMRISSDVDDRTLREIYLPAFERVVKESHPATVMAAYNRLNGIHAAENYWLLHTLLREEWGYTGVTVSDWGGVSNPVASLRAGVDLEMPGTGDSSAVQIVEAIRSGTLDESVLDRAVDRIRILATRADHPATPFTVDEHHDLAREVATECAVLLKNEGNTLPLTPGTRLAVIGEFARSPRYQGGGSSHVTSTRVDTALAALRAVAANQEGEVTFAPGFALDATADADAPGLLAEAVTAASTADVAVVFAGLADTDESEGFDRTVLELPASQVSVIQAVADVSPRTVVVLSNGGIVTLEGWHDRVEAILEGFLLGQASGIAITELLFGESNPSGRLAETIPQRLADTASYINFPGEQGHVRYGEGVMVGYRWQETVGITARYPFGHGLSYTTFELTDLRVAVVGQDRATASLVVTNTGPVAGAYVVQIYVSTTGGSIRRPARELRDFAKLQLQPGQSRTVQFDLTRRAFAYWDTEIDDWVVTPGEYVVQANQDAATVVLEETITLLGDTVLRELTLDSTIDEWLNHPTSADTLQELFAGASEEDTAVAVTPELLRMVGSMPMRKLITMVGDSFPAGIFENLMDQSRVASRTATIDGPTS